MKWNLQSFSKNCPEYQAVLGHLPTEEMLHRWYRDAKAGRHQHRFKVGYNAALIDICGESAEIPIAACRYLRFWNDFKASEVLGSGAFAGFCELRNRQTLEFGHKQMAWAASLRRTAEQLKSRRTGMRPKNSDLLGILPSALFEFMWQDLDLRSIFLSVLESYQDSDEVPERIRYQLASQSAQLVNGYMDDVDRIVFGKVTSCSDKVFEDIMEFWNAVGPEWIVARDSLIEFLPY